MWNIVTVSHSLEFYRQLKRLKQPAKQVPVGGPSRCIIIMPQENLQLLQGGSGNKSWVQPCNFVTAKAEVIRFITFSSSGQNIDIMSSYKKGSREGSRGEGGGEGEFNIVIR